MTFHYNDHVEPLSTCNENRHVGKLLRKNPVLKQYPGYAERAAKTATHAEKAKYHFVRQKSGKFHVAHQVCMKQTALRSNIRWKEMLPKTSVSIICCTAIGNSWAWEACGEMSRRAYMQAIYACWIWYAYLRHVRAISLALAPPLPTTVLPLGAFFSVIDAAAGLLIFDIGVVGADFDPTLACTSDEVASTNWELISFPWHKSLLSMAFYEEIPSLSTKMLTP